MAAMQGFQLAQSNLAAMYVQGHGVKKDIEEARRWYQEAAKRGGPIGKDAEKKLIELGGQKQEGKKCIIM